MRRDRLLTLLGLLGLVVLAYIGGAVGFGRAIVPSWRDDTIPLVVRFDHVRSLDVGTAVVCRGVTIGRVSEAPYLEGEQVAVPVRIDRRHWSRLNESSAFALETRNYLTQEQVIEVSTPAAEAGALQAGAIRQGKIVDLTDALREAVAGVPLDIQLPLLGGMRLSGGPAGEINSEGKPLASLAIRELEITPTNMDGNAWDSEPGFDKPDVFVEVRQHGRVIASSAVARDTLTPSWPEALVFHAPVIVDDASTLDVRVFDKDYLSYNDPVAHLVLTPGQLARLVAGEELTLQKHCAAKMVVGNKAEGGNHGGAKARRDAR